jgi:hypothetical protein
MRIKIFILLLIISSFALAIESDVQPTDTRAKVTLKTEEKDFVLERMRRMLETLTAIQVSLADESPEKVDDLVLLMFQYSRENHPDDMHQTLPEGFKKMSKQMNKHWKNLRKENTDSKFIQREVVTIMSTCNACHRSYRIE